MPHFRIPCPPKQRRPTDRHQLNYSKPCTSDNSVSDGWPRFGQDPRFAVATLNLMVFHGARLDEIFLSTFIEKAALQLKQGLKLLLAHVTNVSGQPYYLSHLMFIFIKKQRW